MNALLKGHVRAACPEDAEQIAAVHVRSWQAAYRDLLPQDYLDRLDPADRAERWRHSLRDADPAAGGVIVAVNGGRVCGATWFGRTRDTDTDAARVGELIDIYLLREAWDKGVGRMLMNAAVEHLAAAGYLEAMLWVLESNACARRAASYRWLDDWIAENRSAARSNWLRMCALA